MFVVTVDGTAEHQLQHSAELTLVTSLRCNSTPNSQQLQQPNTDQRRMDIGKLRSMEDTTP